MKNIQIQRDEIRNGAGCAPKIEYYLGWGQDGQLQGDPMSFEELKALHALTGQVIARNSQTN